MDVKLFNSRKECIECSTNKPYVNYLLLNKPN